MEPVKLDLRERTKDFALSVVRIFSALPKTTEAQILGRQVLRSGTSIGANYREAYRSRSRSLSGSADPSSQGAAAAPIWPSLPYRAGTRRTPVRAPTPT